MSIKKFMDLSVGTKFKTNNIEYIKIPDERVSCCTVHNATLADNSGVKVQILPLTEVEIDDQLQ